MSGRMRSAIAPALVWALVAASAGAGPQPVRIADFNVLDRHPSCTGPGETAFRVAFEEVTATARFGVLSAERPGTCRITTRRGSDIQDVEIPCPDDSSGRTEGPAAAYPEAIEVTGDFVGCLGLGSVAFVEGRWSLGADMPSGRYQDSGDLSRPGVSVAFRHPSASLVHGKVPPDYANPPVVAVIFDGLEVTGHGTQGGRVDLSSYLVLAPFTPVYGACNEVTGRCFSHTPPAGFVLGGASRLVRYVDRE